MKEYLKKFMKFSFIGVIPYLLIIILESILIKRIRFMDMLLTQLLVVGIISGAFGLLTHHFKKNKIIYNTLLLIFIAVYLAIVVYLIWLLLLDLNPFQYKDI
ncbi:hypothetical protein HYX01_02035 [Candidatus Woesearchaeota archaeon]|nr:hypothetical protein [Candidatus Woesearchaeota archaeon]